MARAARRTLKVQRLRRITRTRGSMASAMDYSWPVVVDDRLPFCMGLRRVGEAEGRHGD